MKIALVTCESMPTPDKDGGAVEAALAGHAVETVAWSAACDWSRFDIVMLRTPWDYPFHAEAFGRWVDSVGDKLVNPAPVVRWNMHKGYLLELAARGVPIVPTKLVTRPEEVDLTGDEEVVVKPAIGSGARGAMRGPAGSLAEGARAAVAKGALLVQPFVPQIVTEGELSLVYLGGAFSHAVRKTPRAGDYRVQAEHGGALANVVPTAEERRIAELACACAPGKLTYARVDMVAGMLMELEVIEPELFLRREPGAAEALAAAVTCNVR